MSADAVVRKTCASCPGGSRCCGSYTALCCTLPGGDNFGCPPNTFVGGWWQCNYGGTNLCSTTNMRYYLDCSINPGAACPGGCHCGSDDCTNFKTCCVVFRYGQCNTDIPYVTADPMPSDHLRDPVPDRLPGLRLLLGRRPAHVPARGGMPVSLGALTALVIVETIVVCLLAVVVVSLLRSHAELLRRLPAPEDEQEHHAHGAAMPIESAPAMPSSLPAPKRRASEARDVAGTTLGGDQVVVSAASGTDTLFAFLSSGCLTCQTFWDGLRPGVARADAGRRARRRGGQGSGLRVAVEARDARAARRAGGAVLAGVGGLRGADVAVLLLRGRARRATVRSEGAAMRWDQVSSLLTDALFDEARGAGEGERMSPIVAVRPRDRGRGRSAIDVVALRRVDAGKHHPARGAGTRIEVVGDGVGLPRGLRGGRSDRRRPVRGARRGAGRRWMVDERAAGGDRRSP